ncbi:hypothetical protein K7I13_03120 [Brucepastera parasyntrophica]|uniref:hypothetical protein n=1 Tax=Brucepastera parasyntrophica TaxID=2880008 RepID=UPI00210D3B92|nr:hypothetical protein [Brucepastera parasyntrophica]ULQ60314.1 hypothetical protein K7I13_03120 [Brucepastera parasyntrophica]
MGKKLDETLASYTDSFEKSLTPESRENFLEKQRNFYALQRKEDSPELLALIPHLRREDLSGVPDRIETEIGFSGTIPVLTHEQPTNGIAYMDIGIPVDTLPPGFYPLLPFFASAFTGMGLSAGKNGEPALNWAEASALLAQTAGGFGTSLYSSSPVQNTKLPELLPGNLTGRDLLIIRIKMLEELIPEAVPLLFRFLENIDFSDKKRLEDLLLEYKNDLGSSIAPAGNQYAISRSAAFTGRSRAIDEIWNGISQIQYIRALCKKIQTKKAAARLAADLDEIHTRLLSAGIIINITGTSSIITSVSAMLPRLTEPFGAPSGPDSDSSRAEPHFATLLKINGKKRSRSKNPEFEFIVSSSLQVGFAAAVLPAPPYGTFEQAVVTVLGNWLANGVLWEQIRTTGGAYGAFAFPDSLEKLFILATYRDPQPLRSLAVFREALTLVSGQAIDPVDLEKTIAGCYSREIQPRSPADKGFTAFIRILYGITDELRLQKIKHIISVQPEDIQTSARNLFKEFDTAKQVILGGKKQIKTAKKTEFTGNNTKITI